MSRWQIAFVKEQGVHFSVVLVKDSAIQNRSTADDLISDFTFRLGQPVVLLGERRHRLYGRHDIVRFLQNVHPSQLPWRKVDIAA